jgi:hypothetical protein
MMGFIADHTNARWPLAVGGATALLTVAYTASMSRRGSPEPAPAPAAG